MSANSGIVASSLIAPLIDGPLCDLHVVHRSSAGWQLADDDGLVVACVITARAIRLPHAVVVPSFPRGSSPISAGGGSLGWNGSRTTVARWFEPARPNLPSLSARLDPAAVDAFARRWSASIGLGDGLTPFHDDVVCGALAALSAAGHPAVDAISGELQAARLEEHTTAVSAALLRFAARGYCIDPLARFLTALADGNTSPSAAAARRQAQAELMAVGHSSGRGMIDGVHSVLCADELRGAA